MSLDSIIQVLWGGEISTLALIVTLLPLICQSLGNSYYLGENISKYILNKKIVLKDILKSVLIENIIILCLAVFSALLPENNIASIIKTLLILVCIVLLILVFVKLFKSTYFVIKCLVDDTCIRREIESIYMKTFHDFDLDKKNDHNDESIDNKIKELTDKWYKHAIMDYGDAKKTIRFVMSLMNEYSTFKFTLNNTLSAYVTKLFHAGHLNVEELTDLLVFWNNECNKSIFNKSEITLNEPIMRLMLSTNIIKFIADKENNNVASSNTIGFQNLMVTLTFSRVYGKAKMEEQNTTNNESTSEQTMKTPQKRTIEIIKSIGKTDPISYCNKITFSTK